MASDTTKQNVSTGKKLISFCKETFCSFDEYSFVFLYYVVVENKDMNYETIQQIHQLFERLKLLLASPENPNKTLSLKSISVVSVLL